MKKVLFLLGGLLSSVIINAQIISYSDAAILFSSEENNGTARFSAMSGAFGALGGDISAGDINPAGLAVLKDTESSLSFGLRDTDINTSFFGTNIANNDNFFNLTQVGGALIFDTNSRSNWNKVALGFNYSLAKDFENSYLVEGNAGITSFNNDPFLNNDNDPNNDVFYESVDGQFFNNITAGQNEKFTFSLAGQYNENLYLGFSVVAHNLEFYQRALFEEESNDGNGNLLDASLFQELYSFGDGVGFNMGFIAKLSQEVRIGGSYQTPVWYTITDEFEEDLIIDVSNNPQRFNENSGISVFDYELRTPSKLTGSFAYVVGKEGLLSFDYTYKNFKNTKLKPTAEFVDENADFSNFLKNTSTFRVGGEWRLDNVSLRGGYYFEESPYEDAIDSDHTQGYSVGIGFKFGDTVKLDLAYQNTTNTDISNFLGIDDVAPAELDITNDKFTATLVIGL